MFNLRKITWRNIQDIILIFVTIGFIYLAFNAYLDEQQNQPRGIECYKGYSYTVDTIGVMRPMFKMKSFLQYEVIKCEGENDGR